MNGCKSPSLRVALVGCFLLSTVGPGTTLAADDDWVKAAPGYEWSFPQDHLAHRDYRTEWWYLTGHLEGVEDPSVSYGFQFTIFRLGLGRTKQPAESGWSTHGILMGHASVVDKTTGDHRFSELLYREIEPLARFGTSFDEPLAWTRGPAGTDGTWSVRFNGEAFDFAAVDAAQGFAYELSTRPLKPLIFQGPGGFSEKTEDGTSASLYYSFTRLAVSGTATVDGRRVAVRGEAWMDKEFSTSHLGDDQVGWDWFSTHLADGRELMVYQLRRADGSRSHATGTLVDVDGNARYLGTDAIELEPGRTWTSDATGARYPIEWRVRVPSEGLDLSTTPVADDQENVTRAGPYYWEGAIELRTPDGRTAGRGYLEMTGYGEGSKPPI